MLHVQYKAFPAVSERLLTFSFILGCRFLYLPNMMQWTYDGTLKINCSPQILFALFERSVIYS